MVVQIPQSQVPIGNQIQILSLAAELKLEEHNLAEALYFAQRSAKIVDSKGSTLQQCMAHESIAYIYARMQPSVKFELASDQAIVRCELA